MDTLLNVRAFLATVRAGNFSRAARELSTVPSVVSKRVAQLEWELGAPLFERNSRRVTLTEAGQRFHPRAGRLLAQFDELAASLHEADASGLAGLVRIKAPTSITVAFLAQMLGEFQAAHPHITLDVLLADRPLNPLEEGVDIVVAGREDSYEGVIDVPLAPLRQIVCAAPTYLARRGAPAHPAELAQHDCLVFSPVGPAWQFESEHGMIEVEVQPRLTANDNHVVLASARAGNGIALLPSYVARSAVDFGLLVPVLSAFALRPRRLKAMVPAHRAEVPRVQAVLAWLRERLGETPSWDR
ncbi:LysR family transcriptional regulator [Verticiella sediminum]|uniref:LysR family transcriptional regulator n=1 Tax=Verticiella sediminum TaxID=1247510 RepID=A0A556AIX3_9BURK|nr:LysR family transcriptional regulator [Verticiella sediminum]TSH92854.1 LysR family transcriptional regulator [Verticiella sediminum]